MRNLVVALYITLLFVIVSLPWTYKMTDRLLGKWQHTVDAHNTPTMFGLLLHTIIFFLLVFASTYMPGVKYFP